MQVLLLMESPLRANQRENWQEALTPKKWLNFHIFNIFTQCQNSSQVCTFNQSTKRILTAWAFTGVHSFKWSGDIFQDLLILQDTIGKLSEKMYVILFQI